MGGLAGLPAERNLHPIEVEVLGHRLEVDADAGLLLELVEQRADSVGDRGARRSAP